MVGEEDYEDVRKKLTFGSLPCCFICKLPLDWCEETGEEGGCVYKDKVLPVVLMALRSSWVRELAKEGFGIKIDDREVFF